MYTSATNSTFSFSGLSPLDVSAEEASRPIASHIQKKEGEREKKKHPDPEGMFRLGPVRSRSGRQ